jgi:hypothetical protein
VNACPYRKKICPNCRAPLSLAARICMSDETKSSDVLFDLRFGLIAMIKGSITQEQLLWLLEIQLSEEIEYGSNPRREDATGYLS